MPIRAFIVKSGWLADEGQRLDAAAYAEGGFEARDRIKVGPWRYQYLDAVADVTLPNRFARRYVMDPGRGVPFLSSSDILLADLKGLALLSRQASRNLTAPVGTILVTRSGTVGRTVYLRGEMAHMTFSEDVLRVAARHQAVKPGYLFAFLSSLPAQAMIRQRVFGSVVQHIGPADLRGLPVPLFAEDDQTRIHNLVSKAAAARTEAAVLLDQASSWFDTRVDQRPDCLHEHARAVGVVHSSSLAGRLDAFHHIGWAARFELDGDRLGDIAEVSKRQRTPRVWADRGVPFLSGIDVFQVRPSARVRLARHVAARAGVFVSAGQLLMQASGQRYGLLGRAAYVGKRLEGWAASDDLIRIEAGDELCMARIFAFARSDVGRRSILRHSYGTSIPHINQAGVAEVTVPSLPTRLSELALRALVLREEADDAEERAIREVESWLG